MNRLAFEGQWLDRLLALKTVLREGRWQPARTVSFVVDHPKTREIHAPDFADRIVHHILVERLEKIFEPIFIEDSFANRKGKGSHAAVDRLQQFMGRRNGQGWFLQLDIHNFFNSIHRPTLYQLLCRRIEKAGDFVGCETCSVAHADQASGHAPAGFSDRCGAQTPNDGVFTPYKIPVLQQHASGVSLPAQFVWLKGPVEDLQSMLASYWGHFAQADSVRLRRDLFARFAWLACLYHLQADGSLSRRWVLEAASFAAQCEVLRAEWPQALCLIEKGNRWVVLGESGPGFRCAASGLRDRAWREREFDATGVEAFKAGLRAARVAYVCAAQTGWLRHGVRRREVLEWFVPVLA